MARQREEVINVELARLLQQRGIAAVPETILQQAQKKKLPDVIIDYRGLRVVLEGKLDDGATSRTNVETQARERVGQGIAHIAVAVMYPKVLGTTPHTELGHALETTPLEIQVHSESEVSPWLATYLDGLSGQLNRVYDNLIRDDVVNRAIEILQDGIMVSSRVLVSIATGPERLGEILGIPKPPDASS